MTFCFLALANCSTSTKSSGPQTDLGIWQGKALILNKTVNNKKWANVTWASDSINNRMRIDVYALMDMPLATYIQVDGEAHLWMFTEKKYFVSKNPQKLFKYLTKLSLNPNIFYSFLGRPAAPNTEWNCEKDNVKMMCKSQAAKTNIKVDFSDTNERIIKISRAGKSLRLRLSRAKVQTQDRDFELLSTSQFKTIKI